MWNGVTDILKCTQVDMVGGLGSEGDLDQRKGVEQGGCDTRQGFSLWEPLRGFKEKNGCIRFVFRTYSTELPEGLNLAVRVPRW